MNRLRGVILMLAAALFLLVGAGTGWALEIVAVEGRPWDTGAIGVDGQDRNDNVRYTEPAVPATVPGGRVFAADRRSMTLEDWLAVVQAYLHP